MSAAEMHEVFFTRHADDPQAVRDMVTLMRMNLTRLRELRGVEVRRGERRSGIVRGIVESFWNQAPRVLADVAGSRARILRVARLMVATGAALGGLRLWLLGVSRPPRFTAEHAQHIDAQIERFGLGDDSLRIFLLMHAALGEICERGDAAAQAGPRYIAAEGPWREVFESGAEVPLDYTVRWIGDEVLRLEASGGSTETALLRVADCIVEHGRKLMALAETLADAGVR